MKDVTQIHYDNVVEALVEAVPALRACYEAERRQWGDESPGPTSFLETFSTLICSTCFTRIARTTNSRCCASKPGKPVLELCLAHLPNRGDARWKLSDNGAIKNLVQIGVK